MTGDNTSSDPLLHELPRWLYKVECNNGIDPSVHHYLPGQTNESFPELDGPNVINLGSYQRKRVSNVDVHPLGRAYFDIALRLMLSYQHEIAAKFFIACLHYAPYAVLAHGFIALCHSPNYNFKGMPYYASTSRHEDVNKPDLACVFPSQEVADRHSKAAVEKLEEIRRLHRQTKKKKGGGKKKGTGKPKSAPPSSSNDNVSNKNNDHAKEEATKPELVTEVETLILQAIRVLTCSAGVCPDLADETVGRPFAAEMRKVYNRYPSDPEVAYCFAESMMVLNAWQLYDYPSGKPVSPDVLETKTVLEQALELHPTHAGLCHMYVHLSEMSATPQMALKACEPLRKQFPHAGHLIHMPTHIDVQIGDYESCVRYNEAAIEADLFLMKAFPHTAERECFYFGYIVHDFHMAVYGAILGGFEKKAMEIAHQLNQIVNEKMFREYPDLASYLESYAALDIHAMVRFGRWKEILELAAPKDKRLMLFRAASLAYARGLAFAATGNIDAARREADRLDGYRQDEEATQRILHNNTVAQLLAVDSTMMRGEIAYHEGKHEEAFKLLRVAVQQQDDLNYDEPWGKMQPIRHALGGLLLEQGQIDEAKEVFRVDLRFHPKNPWALVGLIHCLKASGSCCSNGNTDEIVQLEEQLRTRQESELADFKVVVACECCTHPN
uniref:Uncharacterized protein n=1 Tax=Amphora coffeiformis TaxID=265554 RepID=A0A7S3KVN2_9STRA